MLRVSQKLDFNPDVPAPGIMLATAHEKEPPPYCRFSPVPASRVGYGYPGKWGDIMIFSIDIHLMPGALRYPVKQTPPMLFSPAIFLLRIHAGYIAKMIPGGGKPVEISLPEFCY
jgi:hypothetical protein